MSEKVISPGVFTKEIDQSFLPQGISQIGGAFIGPTLKGTAFVPTLVTSISEFVDKFGNASPTTFLPYAVQSYLKNSGYATIVRVLPSKGYVEENVIKITCDGHIIGLLTPNKNGKKNNMIIYSVGLTGSMTSSNEFNFYVSSSLGTTTYNASLIPTRANYLGKVFSDNPDGTKNLYLYVNFVEKARELTNNATMSVSVSLAPVGTLEFTNASTPFGISRMYNHAQTPWITSQLFGGGMTKERYNLFKVHTLGDGENMNREFKIAIMDIRTPNKLVGEEYGSFTLAVRKFNDSDMRPEYLEVFQNLNLNPESKNYVARAIGDRFGVFNENTKKIEYIGEFPNKSKFIRVEMSPTIASIPKESVPFGFREFYCPIGGPDADAIGDALPKVTFVTKQGNFGMEEYRIHFGFDFNNLDNWNYLKPMPAGTNTGLNVEFGLDSNAIYYTSSTDLTGSNIDPYVNFSDYIPRKKFVVAFQGGFDGANPALPKYTGGDGVYENGNFTLHPDYVSGKNIFGFDCSTPTSDGTMAYKKAINILSNEDEYDINLLVLPGIISSLHPAVTTHAKNMVEQRGDCFYIMDICTIKDGVREATDAVQGLDTNYAAGYYPWIKIQDLENNKTVWVPPSVAMAGVYAFNDRIGFEWFAPAGLTRGTIVEALEAKIKLTRQERDDLYSNRINPIATFPGQGVVVWGQKTFQVKASALDRINVRRLLIHIKKFIASTARFLVFEPNNQTTRNRFLNMVNPYLDGIRQRAGLYKFKVISDESNNSNEDIARNILRAEILIQPTATAEFIVVPIVIKPTGASFEGI